MPRIIYNAYVAEHFGIGRPSDLLATSPIVEEEDEAHVDKPVPRGWDFIEADDFVTDPLAGCTADGVHPLDYVPTLEPDIEPMPVIEFLPRVPVISIPAVVETYAAPDIAGLQLMSIHFGTPKGRRSLRLQRRKPTFC